MEGKHCTEDSLIYIKLLENYLKFTGEKWK